MGKKGRWAALGFYKGSKEETYAGIKGTGKWEVKEKTPAKGCHPGLSCFQHLFSYRPSYNGPGRFSVATAKMEGWDVEVIDENNYQRSAPRNGLGLPDHETLQKLRPADVVGFYGGLTSTIPRLYELARFYRERRVTTIAGGQHFIEENIAEALHNGIDAVVIGEGEETIKELLYAFEGRLHRDHIRGIAYLDNDQVVRTEGREPLTDFDHLPLPDFSLVRYARF